MHYTIDRASDIGGIIRAARKAQQLRQDDAAGSVGVSESFLGKAEAGAASIQWGKLFQILEGLGVRVSVDIPDADEGLLKTESEKARHRAAVRVFLALEQQSLKESRNDEPSSTDTPDASTTTFKNARSNKGAAVAEAFKAALRVLETSQPGVREGATLKRARKLVEGAKATPPAKGGKGSTRK